MTHRTNNDSKLTNFDALWTLGDPVAIEREFQKLLPQAHALTDKSIYLQLLSQIALTQALQKKFDAAHKTLDDAQVLLTPEYELARARILLERARVLQQAGKISEARNYFEQSFELSKQHTFDVQAIDAAHMIAIIAEQPEEKIRWNQLALNTATNASDEKARNWHASLFHNLGQNYIEAQQFDKALSALQKALELREKEGDAPTIRFAKWAVARALRSLGRLDEALALQRTILKECETIVQSNHYDMPLEMFTLTRGYIYEEIAEIYNAQAKIFAQLAYEDLANNEMFKSTTPERLARLQHIQNS